MARCTLLNEMLTLEIRYMAKIGDPMCIIWDKLSRNGEMVARELTGMVLQGYDLNKVDRSVIATRYHVRRQTVNFYISKFHLTLKEYLETYHQFSVYNITL